MRVYERERLAIAALRILVREETRRPCTRAQDVVQRLFVQELERDELGNPAPRVVTLRRHGFEEPQGKFPPEHRSTLQDALQRLAQAVDPCGQEVMDRLGHTTARPLSAAPQVAGE